MKLEINDPALKLAFAKVLDRFFLCQKREVAAFTDFYDPAKWNAFMDAFSTGLHGRAANACVCDQTGRKIRPVENVFAESFGGMPESERRMLGFFPAYEEAREFPIARLRIAHAAKFNKTPRHQDYLGSLLGLGFDRGKFGDILVGEAHTDLFVSREIADYICENLDRVGKVAVKAVHGPKDLETAAQQAETEKIILVSSLRLDTVVAALFRLSRSQAAGLIAGEKVFVNWSPQLNAAKPVKPGDMITLRGYGRAKVGEVAGKTKKDRLRLTVWQG